MKIFALSPYPTFKPTFGGQVRIHFLYREIAKRHQVFQFSFMLGKYKNDKGRILLKSWIKQVSQGYMEYIYFNPLLIALASTDCLRSNPFIFPSIVAKAVNIGDIKLEITGSNLVQVESPYFFDLVFKHAKKARLPIILSEHNVEFKAETFFRPNSLLQSSMLLQVRKMEENATRNADMIFVVSEEDLVCLNRLYEVERKRMTIVPNGIALERFKKMPNRERAKKILNMAKRKVVIFIGSLFRPNVEAVKAILKIAKHVGDKDILFLVVGSVGKLFKNTENVIFTGTISDTLPYLAASDIAINPSLMGGGTSLKMLEYLAAGLPTITTRNGMRGLEIKAGQHVIVSKINDFATTIVNVAKDNALRDKLRYKARNLVQEKYDWKKIAERVLEVYARFA